MTENEFAQIVHETKAYVLSSVEKHLAQRFYHAIDDVVQETYIRAYRSLAKNRFRGDSAISSWLYSIARNESLRMNTRLSREEEKFSKSVQSINEKFGPEDDYSSEEIEEMEQKIKELPEKYRDVMQLVASGYSENDIARDLSIKKGTVKSRASRGREMLKKMYREG